MQKLTSNSYQLAEEMLNPGLTYIISYLEGSIKRFIIVDSNNHIYYPDVRMISGNYHIQIPTEFNGNYYYNKKDARLYYRIKCKGILVYIIVNELPAKRLAKTINILMETNLAIKCYFFNIYKANIDDAVFEKKLTGYLLLKSNDNIEDIVKLSRRDLDINSPYFVLITEVEEENEFDWQVIRAYTREYLNKSKLNIISLAWSNRLIDIIPAASDGMSSENDAGWSWLIKETRYKEFIENKLKKVTSQGIGGIYPLADLPKSYNEACIALSLPRIMGKENYIQQFSELGLYSLIFSQDTKVITNYCYKTLGQLVQYRNKNGGELLSTLRKLLDSGVNWKTTAN